MQNIYAKINVNQRTLIKNTKLLNLKWQNSEQYIMSWAVKTVLQS